MNWTLKEECQDVSSDFQVACIGECSYFYVASEYAHNIVVGASFRAAPK